MDRVLDALYAALARPLLARARLDPALRRRLLLDLANGAPVVIAAVVLGRLDPATTAAPGAVIEAVVERDEPIVFDLTGAQYHG